MTLLFLIAVGMMVLALVLWLVGHALMTASGLTKEEIDRL